MYELLRSGELFKLATETLVRSTALLSPLGQQGAQNVVCCTGESLGVGDLGVLGYGFLAKQAVMSDYLFGIAFCL